MNFDAIDSFIAGTSRPAIALICGVGITGACFIPATAPVAIPVAGAVVVAWMGARSVDKKTAAAVETKKIDAGAQGAAQ